MTNFYDGPLRTYTGTPNFGLPSRRYKNFLDLFREERENAQKRLTNFLKWQKPYETVCDEVERYGLPNDTKIAVDDGDIRVALVALPEQTLSEFTTLANKLLARLVAEGFSNDTDTGIVLGGWCKAITFRINLCDPQGGLTIRVEARKLASHHWQTHTKQRITTDSTFVLVPNTPQTHGGGYTFATSDESPF